MQINQRLNINEVGVTKCITTFFRPTKADSALLSTSNSYFKLWILFRTFTSKLYRNQCNNHSCFPCRINYQCQINFLSKLIIFQFRFAVILYLQFTQAMSITIFNMSQICFIKFTKFVTQEKYFKQSFSVNFELLKFPSMLYN